MAGDTLGRIHFLRLEEPEPNRRPLVDRMSSRTRVWETLQPSSSQILSQPDVNSQWNACDNPHICTRGLANPGGGW